MAQTIKYIGNQDNWFEVAVTGKQSCWQVGQQEERSDAEAALLLATGLFYSAPEPVMTYKNLTGVIKFIYKCTQAEYDAIETPDDSTLYVIVEA